MTRTMHRTVPIPISLLTLHALHPLLTRRPQAGAEMCGTLKNAVALGAGIVDGLGLGPNSKATVIRQGLVEMKGFTKALYRTARDDTFLECCGVGDLVATCTGGRNRLVAEAWTKAQLVRRQRVWR